VSTEEGEREHTNEGKMCGGGACPFIGVGGTKEAVVGR
jgi:hypothetical protein